jgi:hypothetical protein
MRTIVAILRYCFSIRVTALRSSLCSGRGGERGEEQRREDMKGEERRREEDWGVFGGRS